MIKESPPNTMIRSKEEKIAQIKLLYDKAHEYKIKHRDAWKAEEESAKRNSLHSPSGQLDSDHTENTRLNSLVELFKICELLRNVIIEQIQRPVFEQEDLKRAEVVESYDIDNPNDL